MQEIGSIPESGRSPGVGNGNPFQYSFLENPTDRGAWKATVHGAAKTEGLRQTHTDTHTHRHTSCFKTVCRSPIVPLDGKCVSEEAANRIGTQDS